MTIFFSSHVLSFVEKLCTRLAIIPRGRIRAVCTLAEIRASAEMPDDATLEDVFLTLTEEESE